MCRALPEVGKMHFCFIFQMFAFPNNITSFGPVCGARGRRKGGRGILESGGGGDG